MKRPMSSPLEAQRLLDRIAPGSPCRGAHDEGSTRSGERRIPEYASALAAERFRCRSRGVHPGATRSMKDGAKRRAPHSV
jgi:hypothetical protein